MALDWCVYRITLGESFIPGVASAEVTMLSDLGWTVHSTSTYWDSTKVPAEAAQLVVIAHRERVAEPAKDGTVMALFPTQESWESWADDLEQWDQAVLVAV